MHEPLLGSAERRLLANDRWRWRGRAFALVACVATAFVARSAPRRTVASLDMVPGDDWSTPAERNNWTLNSTWFWNNVANESATGNGTARNLTSGALDSDANGVFVTELIATLGFSPYEHEAFYCEIDYAYCGRASCTRFKRDKRGHDSVEIAACACQSVPAKSSEKTQIAFADTPLITLLAQSPKFVAAMSDWVYGSYTYDETQANVCNDIANGEYYPRLHPDRLSLPSPYWDGNDVEVVVDTVSCPDDIAIAVCSGAPCFEDTRDALRGPLAYTCLCPVYPFEGSASFKLTAPDVGHMQGCQTYAYSSSSSSYAYAASDGGYSSYSFSYAYDTSDSGDGGDTSLCARQATSGHIEGTKLQEWTVAAVDAMSTAPRSTDVTVCRNWYGK